jgi:hypothetical protein
LPEFNRVQPHSKEKIMPVPNILGPHIEFNFEGIVVFCAAQGRTHFDAGIVKALKSDDEIPEHVHSIELTKFKGGERVRSSSIPAPFNLANPARLLRLEIGSQAQARKGRQSTSGIQLFRPTGGSGAFDRESAFSRFDWVLDIERELHGGEVKMNNKALRTVLRVEGINQGVFYTGRISDAPVFTEDETGKPGEIFREAEVVVAKIALPASGARLQKLNEKTGAYEEVYELKHEEDVTYRIDFKNVCVREDHCGDVSRFYNDVTQGTLTGNRRVRFVRPQSPLLTTFESQCPACGFGIKDRFPDPAK